MSRGSLFSRWKAKYEHSSIRAKTLLSVFLGSVLLVIGSAGFFFFRYTGMIQESSQRQFSELCTQAGVSLNYMFSSVESNGVYILNSSELLQIFRHLQQSDYTLSQEIDDYFAVSRVTSRYHTNKATKAVRYYFNTDAIYTREQNFIFPLSRIAEKDWYERMLLAKGAPFWVYLPEEDRLSCFQAEYKNVQTGELLGVLEQELDREEVLRLLSSVSSFSTGCTVLTDRSGNLVYSVGEKPREFLERYPVWELAEEKTAIYSGEGERYAANRLDNFFVLAGSIPSPYLDGQMNAPVIETLLFGIIALLIAAWMARLISKSLSGRISRIVEGVSRIRLDSEDYLPVRYDDEITKIEETINRFLETIRNSLRENERIYSQKKQADFRILQEQINPHFLYNCLDSINWMALRSREYQIARMAQLLGRFFRMSLSRGNQLVSVEDELEHIRAYLDIMQIRFENWIQVEYNVESDAAKCFMLKLLLQPLVENAILHGFNGQKQETKILRIHICIAEERLQVTVEDNGAGMSSEQLEKIRNILKSEETPRESFGLWNTNQRLVLYYGKEAGLRLNSAPKEGTRVEFSFPCTRFPAADLPAETVLSENDRSRITENN